MKSVCNHIWDKKNGRVFGTQHWKRECIKCGKREVMSIQYFYWRDYP